MEVMAGGGFLCLSTSNHHPPQPRVNLENGMSLRPVIPRLAVAIDLIPWV